MTGTHAQPPGPTGPALLRTLMAYNLDPFGTLADLAARYGDVVSFGLGPMPLYLINRPDLIEDVMVRHNWNFVPIRPLSVQRALRAGLFTSSGYQHEHQRQMIGPLIHGERITRLGDPIARAGERLTARWRPGAEIEMERAMVRLVVETMADILFGEDAVTRRDELVRPALPVNAYLGTRSTHPFAGLAEALPVLPENRAFWRSMHALDDGLLRLIEERRAAGGDRGDLLSALILARDPDGGPVMTDRQVRDEVISLYTTGNGVTASALLWTWYLLDQHREAEDALHAELDAALGDRLPTAADLPRMPYMEMVLSESMRLFSPAWIVGRLALQQYEIEGYVLPAGARLALSSFVTQRDARYWPEPLRFDPGRWTPEARAARPAFAYYPFSGGERGCLGEEFAWLVTRLLLATLARRWQPRLVHDHALKLEPLIALRPAGGMRMMLEPR
jgi:cytochrome P450